MKTWKIGLLVLCIVIVLAAGVLFLIYRQFDYFSPDYHVLNISKIEIIDIEMDDTIYTTEEGKEIFEIALELHQAVCVKNECPPFPQMKYTTRIYQKGLEDYSGETDVYFTDGKYFECSKGLFYKSERDECYKFDTWGKNAVLNAIQE